MAQAQKPDFVFRLNGRVHLNRQGLQFIRLLAAELCTSTVVMLDTPCYEVVWRVLATHSIHQFPLNFPSRASPCAITFQLDSTNGRASVFIRLVEVKNSWSFFLNPYLSSWLESTPINIAGYISILGYETQNICNTSYRRLGGPRWQSVKVLCYKSEGRWFDSRWSHWNFSLT